MRFMKLLVFGNLQLKIFIIVYTEDPHKNTRKWYYSKCIMITIVFLQLRRTASLWSMHGICFDSLGRHKPIRKFQIPLIRNKIDKEWSEKAETSLWKSKLLLFPLCFPECEKKKTREIYNKHSHLSTNGFFLLDLK